MIGFSFVYWKALIAVLVLGLVMSFIRYLRAYLFKPLMDDVLIPATSDQFSFEAVEPLIFELALLLGVSLVVQPIAVFFRVYGAHWTVASVRRDVDQAVAAKFLAAPLRVHRGGSSGDFLARALNDAQLACQSVGIVYNEVLLNIQLVIVGAIALIIASWQLALFSAVAMPPFLILLSYFGRRIQRQTHRRQETQGDLSQRLLSILSGIKVIKAFQGQRLEEEAFALETGKYFRRHMKVVWNGVLAKTSSELINPLIGFLILGLGLWLMLNNIWGLTIGTLTQFAMTLVIVYKPIKSLTQSFPKIMESTGGAARLFAVLDMQEENADRPDARSMGELEHSIRFKNVHFDYRPGSGGTEILKGIDLEVQRGEVIAIVGRTGTGKSTLVDLVLRFHDPTQGAIEIDGVDLRDIQRESFLDHVAVVTQEPFLFDETIFENIRYGRPEATEAEVHAAAVAASADEFIRQLPEGYDTPVGEFGLRLSGGQRQRLTIARAILANPSILVFDEATSALDAQTERAVQAAIESLRGERTIFLVAHRLSTIQHADRIVVLDEGRIAEIGDHDTLIARPGLYRELVGVHAPQPG
jgi:subfamily B ATP-binding cassette protein MsbA